MANVFAVHSVGNSLVRFLRNTYPADLRTQHPCDFRVLSSGEMGKFNDPDTTLSLFLYRMTINEHLRNSPRNGRFAVGQLPLALDLHYLVTVWSESALAEHTILTWAIHQFHQHSTLTISSLSPEAQWEPEDIVQLSPSELSNEDLMRIWDALEPSYRLSFPYVARVIRIDPEQTPDSRRVVETDFIYTEKSNA
jgi:hypothetical protein